MISCARARLHHDHRHPRLAQHHRGVALVGAAAALEDDRALTHMISDLFASISIIATLLLLVHLLCR